MSLIKRGRDSGESPKRRNKQKDRYVKSQQFSISNNMEIEKTNGDNFKQVEVERNNMPKLIPLICAVQILVHFLKTPNQEILLLQFDPLKRYQIWRFLTPFLIHSGRGDGEDYWDEWHLWCNVLLQVLFGWRLEKILNWRQTGIIYGTSVLSASLLSSVWTPCSFSVGSSDALCGIMMTHIIGYFMIPKSSAGWWWKSCLTAILLTICDPIIKLVFPAYYVLSPVDADNTSHIGGALGGGLAAVWICSGYSTNKFGRSSRLKKGFSTIVIMYCIVMVAINLLYVHIFNYGNFNKELALQLQASSWQYEDFAIRHCNAFWTVKSYIWLVCPVGKF